MSDIKKNINVDSSSVKNFGYTFSIIFFLIASVFYIKDLQYFYYFFVISFLFLFLTLTKPILLKWPNFLWNKFGIAIGHIVSYIIMFILFFTIATLTSFYLKLIGKDPLSQKYDKNIKSYWIKRDKQSSLKNQF